MNLIKAILACTATAAAAAGAAMTNETTAVVATNAPVAAVATNAAPEFSIPKSLVLRMYEAEDSFRDRSLAGPDGKPPFNDLLEFAGLTACGDADLAFAVKDRPRGTMALVPDGLTDEERRKLWPFDIAGFERELERRMVRGEDGCYRLRDEDGTEVAANPTIRWANAEIASWATRELDRCSPRLTPRECEALLGSEEMPEGAAAWRLDQQHCFLLETGDGAWNPRTYTFLLWDGTNAPSILASFDSFPGDREAVAALLLGHRASSANNLAVLEWRHQSLRDSMIPGRIRQFLELARDAGVPVAERNLEVLRSHLPEVFADPEPPAAGTEEYIVKEGDDVYSIAMEHDVTPLVLRRLNPGKDLAEISLGDRIRVPADAAAAAEDGGAHAEAENAVLDAAWLTRTIPKMKADANTPLTIRPLKSIGAGAGWERCYVLSSRTLEMDETESDRRLYFRILDNGSVVPLASSGGFQYDPRDGNAGTRDVFRDVDGDGTTELVCPQMWGADGQTSVEIYRLNGIRSEFCGGDSLIAALCPDFSPTNQTWGGAMGCGIERDAERFPVWFDDPGPLTLSCTYEVPRPPSEVAPGEHAYRSVHRRIPLENVRLPFVPYSPAESGWVAPAARTAATPPKKKPAPPKTEPAPDPTVRTGGGTMVSSAYRSPRNSARALRKETSYIILHTTEGGAEGALPKLSENGECHFAVDTNGTVYTIVDKSRVAFHAGLSMWDGRTDLDGCSIGIAIVGRHDEDIADAQYAALKKLLAELKTTYRVSDARVLAHSMVAYGEPNEWHPERHRGRVRSAMNLATPEVRARLGLLSGPAFDPDVEAGRLSVGDPELAEILYGKKPEKPE